MKKLNFHDFQRIIYNHILLILFTLTLSYSIGQSPIIIDHNCIELNTIPTEWIIKAKDDLHIGYGHTSHGSQLISGMNAIEEYFSNS